MTAAGRPLIAGNWKMNGLRADALPFAADLAARLRAHPNLGCELAVCPPATVLREMAEALAGSGVAVGGQDCHWAERGAHTGDLSAAMLREAGCRYVIVGHSERRAGHGEDDSVVRAKAAAAHGQGLVAIVCVGESEAERGEGRAREVVARQLAGSLPGDAAPGNTVIAYEPVWAIGSGRTPAEAEIGEIHAYIRGRLEALIAGGERIRVLYGGSVKPANAGAILAVGGVDGALVGGASLKADDFWAIARSCP